MKVWLLLGGRLTVVFTFHCRCRNQGSSVSIQLSFYEWSLRINYPMYTRGELNIPSDNSLHMLPDTFTTAEDEPSLREHTIFYLNTAGYG